MFQNDWPDPSIPWQTANRHLLLGQFCQVQTLRPKTQQLCRDSQLWHHTPLQLHLRLNDMSVWPRSSKKAEENQPQTRNSAKVDAYSRSVGSPHGFKDSNFWLTSQPSPGAEASWLCAGRAPAVPTMACPTSRIPRLWSPGPSLRMGCCGIWSPIFPTDLGRVSVDPRFPLMGAAWLEGLQHLSTNLFQAWAWGWFKRFKHCV